MASWAARASNLFGAEFLSSRLADLRRNILSKSLEGVYSCSDSRSALRKHPQTWECRLDALNAKVQLRHITGELLAQRQRRSILQMCPSNFDNLLKLLALLLQSIPQASERGQQRFFQIEYGSDVHDGGESVVGGSGHVDVVVGVHRLLRAHSSSQDLDGAVGDDLVRVHVGLRAGAGLPDDEGEVVDELERGNLRGSLLDGIAELRICAWKC